MKQADKTKVARKMKAALTKLTDAQELLRDAVDILPADRRIGIDRAFEKLALAVVAVRSAHGNAGMTFEEVYPEPKPETLNDRLERQNAEKLSALGM